MLARIALVILPLVTFAGVDYPESISKLTNQADVVVVGQVSQPPTEILNGFACQIRVMRILKAPAKIPTLLSADFVFPPSIHAGPATGMVNKVGLFFLKENGSAYRILPVFYGPMDWRDSFHPAIANEPAVTNGASAGERVLAEVLAAYVAGVGTATQIDDWRILSAFSASDSSYGVWLARPLTGPMMPGRLRVIGIAALIGYSNREGLLALDADADGLGKNERFGVIIGAIANQFRPTGPEDIAALLAIFTHHAGMEKLHDPLTAAIARLRKKEAMPALVALLDSSSVDAQMRAIHALMLFGTFADEKGDMGHSNGPLSHTVPDRIPDRASFVQDRTQQVRFWKSWWTDHRATFGY